MQALLYLFAISVFLVRFASPTILLGIVLSLACAASYPILHLQKFRQPVYSSLTFSRKMYVVSNTIKGMVLCASSPMAAKLLYECLQGIWNTRQILVLGHIYAVLDAVSMCMLDHMQTSTVVHHVAVVLVHVQNCFQGFEEDTYARCSVIYAIFSCFAFQVNLALAKRYEGTTYSAAYVVYLLTCACNWSWQVYYAYTHPFSWHGVLWWLFMFAIIYDDVILLRWLHQHL